MSTSSVTDVFNRPPAIAEDTLQYSMYPPPNLADKASVTTFAACIRSYCETILSGFIWHRDAFEVKVVPNPESKDAWILEGRMRVGDCVDDEWCVVWLLREISSKWDLAIGVYDSDGEFLLIEAAEVLPTWVQPSNSENRVWIHNSRLHLIPLSHISAPSRKRHRRKLPGSADSDDELNGNGEDDDDFISANDGADACRDPARNTFAPPEVQKIIWNRISGYPAALKTHVHTTKAYLPVDIAKALSANPSLVQKAVETFYTRDAIQLRAAHKMARFPPSSSVLRPVKLTRTAYAQLIGQKFFPPKVFGRWEEKEGTDGWRWRDVGMRIAVGFEMLYQESKGHQHSLKVSEERLKSSAEAVKDSLRNNPEYLKYIQNLVSADYFQGQLEGSELYKELETKAALTFVEVRRADDASRPSFAHQVDSAIAKVGSLPETQDQEEDDESWMNVDAQDFDSMLEKTVGTSKPTKSEYNDQMDIDKQPTKQMTDDDMASIQASRLKDLASKVEDFVEGEGDVEGARFEDEQFSDEEFGEDSDDESMGSSGPEEPPTGAERQAAMDKLVASLEQSDYGKMPASYSKSQRVKPTTVETDLVEEVEEINESRTALSTRIEEKPNARPIRQPILPRDRYDGVDSDDETDEEDNEAEDEDDEDDRPQVVGDIEIDMEEEEEEFLEFSRQALGISDEHWKDIIRDRKERGAFLPASTAKIQKDLPKPSTSGNKTIPKARTADRVPRVPQPGPRPNVNPELDSFEAVMKALDDELAKLRHERMDQDTAKPRAKGKKPQNAPPTIPEEDDLKDIEAAMEAELSAALERGDSDEEMEGIEGMDYNLIKNFLESFKSQGGLSGPVSNLAGRLQPGWKLPRDQS